MTQLTITAKGQVTFKKDLLKHLGVKPGEKVDVSLLPDGRVELKPMKPSGSIEGFVGLLKGKTKKRLSIAEMNKIAAEGWSRAK
jgi:AbrB family looped-hinge helix DNA binding protein